MLFQFGFFVILASILSISRCQEFNCTNGASSSASPNNSFCLTPDRVCQLSYVGVNDGLDPTVIEYIVSQHNTRRAKIASGGEARALAGKGPQQSTRCMSALTWSMELATSAQNWANQCLFKLDTNRNKNQAADAYAGQLAYGYIDPPGTASNGSINQYLFYWDQAIQSWYDSEITQFDPNTVANYTANPRTVHLTQFIWGRTNEVGCGFRQWLISGGRIARILVCNYWPAGNLAGKPVYKPLSAKFICEKSCTEPDTFYNTNEKQPGVLCQL